MNLMDFLKNIGFEQPPTTAEEIQAFTAKVIECMSATQTHEFIVHADRSSHVPAQTTGEMTWDEKERLRTEAVKKTNRQLQELMEEIGVANSGVEDGYFDFAATLTRQQAIALRESDLIQGLSAKHPDWITMI